MDIEELKGTVSALKPLTPKYKKELTEELAKIYPGYGTKEAACLFYLGLSEPPSCRVCGERTPFYPLAKSVIKAHIGGWNDVCSHQCSSIKNKETCLEKYGTTHHLKKDSTSNSIKKQAETNQERYGVSHVLQNKSINDSMQKAIKEKNGGYHYMDTRSNSGVQEKIKSTTQNMTGFDYYFQTEDCKKKIVETNLKNTGYRYPSQSPELRQKAIETWMVKHGVSNPFQSRKIIEQSAITRYRKESEEHPNEFARRFYVNLIEYGDSFALEYELQHIKEAGNENSLIGIYNHTGIPLSHINSILVKNPELRKYINFDTRWTSFPERDLIGFFESKGLSVLKNDRKILYPKELDCVFPDQKVAVEVNGVYYHSEYRGGKDSKYHLEKTDRCNEQGYKLFHFTDIQLETKRDIIFSMVSNALGITENKIYARRTNVKILSESDYSDFFDSNHIDGNAKSKFGIGLYYQDELVMCISFDSPRNGHDKGYEYEIVRMATKLNTNVVGGFQKIWKLFIEEYSPSSVMSYQDRKYSGLPSKSYGSVMQLKRITSPSWDGINIKTGETKHRMWFTTNRLQTLFGDKFDPTSTIRDNMVSNNFDRIWNCGHYVWEYKKIQ